jgi:hypothetical protein
MFGRDGIEGVHTQFGKVREKGFMPWPVDLIDTVKDRFV